MTPKGFSETDISKNDSITHSVSNTNYGLMRILSKTDYENIIENMRILQWDGLRNWTVCSSGSYTRELILSQANT